MRILVDEMPENVQACPFSRINYKEGIEGEYIANGYICIIDARACNGVLKCRRFKEADKRTLDDMK